MKAGWIYEFRAELEEQLKLYSWIKSMALHQESAPDWIFDGAAPPAIPLLHKALAATAPVKVGRQKRYLFGVEEGRAVVDVEFSVFPKSGKLTLISEKVSKARDHSQHKFDAHHDALTSCKNRKSFERAIRDALDSMASVAVPSSPSLGSGAGRSLALITLDIDFFKRINDSRGHDYGDLVLRTFAWFVDEACQKASAEYPGVQFELFRLGGEEFNILVVGDLEERELLAWVEALRESIQRAVLPSNAQLKVIERDAGVAAVVPVEVERRVTASFGIARIAGVVSGDVAKIASRLKMQADKALYSAKNSGRNRVRYFPDILKRFGRVVENDKSAGAVIIDIGSEVGVSAGTEFYVVPEKYAGDVDYVIDDGRTQRRAGKYPRIKIARVVAFDVQPEISFCVVADRRESTEILSGCLLESIPLGTFGGLSSPHSPTGPLVDGDPKQVLRQRILASSGPSDRVAAIRLVSMQEVDRQHGSVRANELLAAAVASITRELAPPVKVVQVEVGSFGVVFSSQDMHPRLQALVASLRGICGDIADFSMGIFDGGSLLAGEGAGYSLNWENAYEYAVVAAAAAGKSSYRVFDPQCAADVLASGIRDEQYDRVIADCTRFKEVGISGAALENYAGLARFATADLEGASAAFRASVELEGGNATYRFNYGITLFLLRRFIEAFENLSRSISLVSLAEPEERQRGLYAVCAFESYKAGGSPDILVVESLFDRARHVDKHSFIKAERFESSYAEFLLIRHSMQGPGGIQG